MTKDNGMDVTPSWQELADQQVKMAHENEVLRKHIEDLHQKLRGLNVNGKPIYRLDSEL